MAAKLAVCAVLTAAIVGSNAQNSVRLNNAPANALVGANNAGEIGAVELEFEVFDELTGNRNTNYQCVSPCTATVQIQYLSTDDEQLHNSFEQASYRFSRWNFGFMQENVAENILSRTGTVVLSFSYNDLDVDVRITVLPGPATGISASVDRSVTRAGFAITVTCNVVDANDNVVTNASPQTIQLARNTSNSNTTIVARSGTGSTEISTTDVGAVQVDLSAVGLSVTPSSLLLYWGPDVTDRILFVNSTLETQAGDSVTVNMLAIDEHGNLNTNEGQSVDVLRNGGNAQTVAFTSGVASLSVSSPTPQRMQISLAQATIGGQPQMNGVNRQATMRINFTAVCDGVTEYQDEPHQITCKSVRDVCEVGTRQSIAPNATTNRVCAACNASIEYQDQPNQLVCKPFSESCDPGQFQSVVATSSTDRSCSSCVLFENFSNISNAISCTNVTECQAGEAFIAETTLTSDRLCEACPVGFYDSDGPTNYGACSPCNPILSADVYFNDDTSIAVSQPFNSSTSFTLASSVYTSDILEAASLSILRESCRSNRSSGFLLENMLFTTGATTQSISVSLIGISSVFGRGFLLSLNGSTTCQDLSEWIVEPKFTASPGLSECSNLTVCGVGEETAERITHASDQTCRDCNGLTEYQDIEDSQYCAAVQICPAGEREFVAPNATSDRTCGPVTCPGLDPPLYGSITNCGGSNVTEAYLTECVYSCPTDRFFRPVPEHLATRTCVQAGIFSGGTYTCQCFGSLKLDTQAGECRSSCPEGFITGPDGSTCVECSPACDEGQFESTTCDPVAETDRVCSTCSTCAQGTWAVGGCESNTTVDTICAPWSDCDSGYYEVLPPPTATTDRSCDLCDSCVAGLYAVTGCCGTLNTECDALTPCGLDEFEADPPQPAPQGGLGTDRRCQKRKSCGFNEWVVSDGNSTSDRVCAQCSLCPEGEYRVSECTESSDTDCTPFTSCPTGFYSVGGSPFQDATCVECTSCSHSEWEVSPCSSVNDTVCEFVTICDGQLEYEFIPPTFSTDRQCANCSVCEDDEVIAEPCGALAPGGSYTDTVCGAAENTTASCPRGFGALGTAPFTLCVECRDCDGVTSYAKEGKSCSSNETASIFDPRCEPITECAAGFVEIQGPTTTSDRVCSKGITCPTNYYATVQLLTNNVSELECAYDPPCVAGTYQTVDPTSTSPRACYPCSRCPVGQYISRACATVENPGDTVCSAITECSTGEQVVWGSTMNRDVSCTECSSRVKGHRRPNDDPFLCPEEPPDICPSPPGTTPTGPTSVYSQIRMIFSADFQAIVQTAPEYSHQLEFFTESLETALGNFLDEYNITMYDLSVSEGSIVSSFNVFDVVNGSSHTEQAQLAADALRTDSFAFEYFDTVLSVDPSSITITEIDPITTSPTPAPTTASPSSTMPTEAPTSDVNLTTVDPNISTTDAVVEAVPSEADDGLSGGEVAGIVIGAVVAFALVILLVVFVQNKYSESPWSNGVFNATSKEPTSDDGDEYLNMSPEDDGVFDSQLADENRKLQGEVDEMAKRIAAKNAVISGQLKSQRQAQETLEAALAAKLKKENSVIQAEISAMKRELKSKQKSSQFQTIVSHQAKLKAEKLALEEEIARSDEVAQIALDTLAEYDTQQRAFEEEEVQAREAELKRIADEKARLAEEMQKLEQQQNSVYSPASI